MERNEALARLDEIQRKLYAFNTASSSLHLDAVTVAPKDTGEGRGLAQSILAGQVHALATGPELAEVLDVMGAHKDELDQTRLRQYEELRRSVEELTRIPAQEYMAYSVLLNEAQDVWHKAKEKSDFAMFRPYLEQMVAYSRKFAGYYDPNKAPYDALLDRYERGVDMAYLDRFFAVLRERLVPLIRAVGQRPQPDVSFLHRHYPVAQQSLFSDYLMQVMGLDRGHCAIGMTEHPFTLDFNSKDVRITTHYHEDDVSASMYSVIHEGGHARYAMDVDPRLDYTVLAGGASMGIHESQSRFYENIVGRSRPFIEAIFPKMRELFPSQLADVTAEAFWRAVNKAQPSLIRTEADELTYCLHVMIRYEIEKALIDGSLAVKDVPGTWNRLYKEYLGVDVPDDRRGCLQDSHWSGGMIGYFPSYALGSAYGAQMLANMERDMDVWGPVAKGELGHITAWLTEKVHRFGRLLTPAQVIENACGAFDPTYYTNYLTKKYTALYGL